MAQNRPKQKEAEAPRTRKQAAKQPVPTPEPQVFFSDGVAITSDDVAVSAGFNEAPEAASSRIYLRLANEWIVHEVTDDFIVSLTFRDGVLYGLGRNGLVKTVGRTGMAFTEENVIGKFATFRLAEAEDRGQLARIRFIGVDVYACGWDSQIYRITGRKWETLNKGINAKADDSLLDIDGTGPDDIYAVGMRGALLHFDGSRWSYLDSPTNSHFYSVKSLSRDDVLLVGADGGLYRGNRREWRFIGDEEITDNFWSIERFASYFYIAAGNNKLLRHSRGRLTEVDFGQPFQPHTYRLGATPERLWSFGSDHVLAFDGSTWKEAVCPDNE